MASHAADTGRPDVRTGNGKEKEYEVLLVKDSEYPGYAVLCPAVGCASQGDTREEALDMIADAIAICLDVGGLELSQDHDAIARMAAEFEADGCQTEKATVKPADWDRIIADCAAAIARNPDDAKAYMERGGAYLSKGEHDRAIVDYTTVISLIPDDAEAYCRRGDAHFNSGEYDSAIADYDAALRRDPYYDIALAGMEAAYVGLWEQRKSV